MKAPSLNIGLTRIADNTSLLAAAARVVAPDTTIPWAVAADAVIVPPFRLKPVLVLGAAPIPTWPVESTLKPVEAAPIERRLPGLAVPIPTLPPAGTLRPLRPPMVALCANRLVELAVVAKKLVEVALVEVDCRAVKIWSVVEPSVRSVPTVPLCANRLVELAVVAKKLVDVALVARNCWKLETAVVDVATKFWPTTCPATESIVYGEVVPIPTLPALVMRSAEVEANAPEPLAACEMSK